MTQKIIDQVPQDSAGAREIGFTIPQKYNASRVLFDNLARGNGERLALTGPGGTRNYAQLCAEACAMGPRLSVAGPCARRPHPVVPRRYAGLSGRLLRRGARRFRAAVDQHADAAGPAAVLSVRRRRSRRRGRCRIFVALQRGGLQGHAAAHADRDQRRRGRTRGGRHVDRRTMAAELSHRTCGGRYRPQRDGVLDVFVRLDRPAQGHRPSAARHGL